ncbi:electron transport complex subunit RsxB [Aquitalea aquatica]|uniref:Electron transport complex subunit RsxB n=1 Tax=Aquitalea aquatica TaxID=3044273 RepID=A0A838YDV3_9NEIS|nr:electron transport complex subunit RsxB [Aquitalea magnusonii]MBA4710657.1 electron transport complex subunit RsxB [Aquitalea magnusonii]
MTLVLRLLLLWLAIWLLGKILRSSALKLRPAAASLPPLAERIDALLPQTQCGQCGHAGCQPYAQALARGEDSINRCPPGGEDGIRKLAALLHTDYLPFAADAPPQKPKAVALIDEATCIGCTLCIQACPVDAILGSAKQMHTVLADECTGCELCLAPCPVDCISMRPATSLPADWRWGYPVIAIKAVKPGTAA